MSAPSGPQRRVGTLELPPDASADMVALLTVAAGPAGPDELLGEAAAVGAFRTSRVDVSGPPHRSAVRRVRLAAATLVTSVVLGGGLAAADVLPTPAQRWVSHALGAVGIDVPSPDEPRADGGPALSPAGTQVLGPTSAQLPGRPPTLREPASTSGDRSAMVTGVPQGIVGNPAAAPDDPQQPDTGIGAGVTTNGGTVDAAGSAADEAEATHPKGAQAANAGDNTDRAGQNTKRPAPPSVSSGNGKPTQLGISTEKRAAAPGQAGKAAGGDAPEASRE